MTTLRKMACGFVITLFIVLILASAFALAGPGQNNQGQNNNNQGQNNNNQGGGRVRQGAPEIGLAIMVGTGLVSLGLYANRKRVKK